MRQPLGEFAQRVVRNGEVAEFIGYLIQCGVKPDEITAIGQRASHNEFMEKIRFKLECNAMGFDPFVPQKDRAAKVF